jgi:pimeloyl-ACP methyl ester carboxylesterase
MPRFFRDRIIDGMTRGLPEGERRDRVRREMEHTDPATVMQATRALIRFSSRDWAAGIDVPTAVVVTTTDQLVPPSRQYRLAASIPGAKIFEVAGDHLACVRAANQFVPALLEACEYVAAEAAARQSSRVNDGRGRARLLPEAGGEAAEPDHLT